MRGFKDEYGYFPNLIAPPMDWVPVTPSDTVDLEDVSRGIYVGTTGDVEVITAKGRTVVIPNLVAGIEHGGRFTRIKAARTTATDIFVLY